MYFLSNLFLHQTKETRKKRLGFIFLALKQMNVCNFQKHLFSVLTAIAHFSWVFLVFYFLDSLYILNSIPMSLPFYRPPLCLTDSFLCFTKVSLFHKVSVVNY